ncbi:MAG: hypothetical protein WC389_21475, partial [Lutibacter sp.]
MANTPNPPTGQNVNFDIFNQSDVFRAQQLQDFFNQMELSMGNQITLAEKQKELSDKKTKTLKFGLDLMIEEAAVRERILDGQIKEKGIIGGTAQIMKNIVDFSKKTGEHNKMIIAQKGAVKKIEDELAKERAKGGNMNKDYEKHLAKTLRDEQMQIKFAEMRGTAMLNAHPFGPKMAKLMSSKGGMMAMGAIVGVFGAIMGIVRGVFNAIMKVLGGAWNMWLKIQTITGNIAADLG